jgi:hypothetical protein
MVGRWGVATGMNLKPALSVDAYAEGFTELMSGL